MLSKLIGLLGLMVTIIYQSQSKDSTLHALSQDNRARIQWDEGSFMDLNFYVQWWNVVSLNFAGKEISPRYDMFVRRGRLGVSGRVAHKLFYQMSFAYDGVGKDSFSQAAGIPNQEDNTTFFPRDIFACYAFHPLLNVTMGYFRPKAGKESIYSSAFSISQEKSWASFQPRIHITGRGIGRETGINVGGLLKRKKGGALYDIGIFDTNHPLIVGENSLWSPLLTGRLVWYIGDPEYQEYPISYLQSGFGQRKGLSLGVNGTYQGQTEKFVWNTLAGVDAQLNYKALDFLVEYNWLHRRTTYLAVLRDFTEDRFVTYKAAWNFIQKNGTIIQPSIMYSSVKAAPQFASFVNEVTGAVSQWTIGVGVNWLINRDRLKLGLHYYRGERLPFAPNATYSYVNGSMQFIM
jgi:hypothetical protein